MAAARLAGILFFAWAAGAASHGGYFRCYYTGKLELPRSYSGLQLLQDPRACARLDADRYDIFIYEPEAVGERGAAPAPSLSLATPERQTVVLAHEEFHIEGRTPKLPERIAEAASTLIGFLNAAAQAQSREGEGSTIHRNLSGEAERFLAKAELINGYHARLTALYSRGSRTQEALAEKYRLFSEIHARCQELPRSHSFGRCLSAPNNAGFAFDLTYTAYYPLLYRLHLALGGNLAATTAAIHGIDAGRGSESAREREAVRSIERAIQAARPERGGAAPGTVR
jgi:Putative aminopeptidase